LMFDHLLQGESTILKASAAGSATVSQEPVTV